MGRVRSGLDWSLITVDDGDEDSDEDSDDAGVVRANEERLASIVAYVRLAVVPFLAVPLVQWPHLPRPWYVAGLAVATLLRSMAAQTAAAVAQARQAEAYAAEQQRLLDLALHREGVRRSLHDGSTWAFARRLFMSIDTANTHLRSIRRKYRLVHPEAPASLPQRTAAQLWARELTSASRGFTSLGECRDRWPVARLNIRCGSHAGV